MTETTTFDARAAVRAADEAVGLAAADAQAQLLREADEARDVAAVYAVRLEAGGDPTSYPLPDSFKELRPRGGSGIVSPYVGLTAVYQAWNEGRGSANPLLPFRVNASDWRLCEHVAERIGEPVPYATLKAGRMSGSGSDAIAKLLLRFEDAGHLVVRRAKVDGKVAFLVRERVPSDPEQGSYRYASIPEEAVHA